MAFAAHADNSIKSTVELGAGWGSIVDGVHDSDKFAGSATAALAITLIKSCVPVRLESGTPGASLKLPSVLLETML